MNQIRKALAVGINIYPFFEDRAGNPYHLTSAENDAAEIANLLEKDGGFTTITRLPYNPSSERDTFPKNFLSNIVGLSSLQNAIENLFNPQDNLKFPDVALFYFSGHGWYDPETKEYFLVTSDSNPSKKLNLLPIRWLQEQIAQSRVRQQVIFLDCCFSGGLFLNFDLSKESTSDRCLITACRPSQIAQENLENGFLTQKLLERLTISEDRGFVTNYGLESWINSLKFANGQEPLCQNWGQRAIILTDQEWPPLSSNECPYRSLNYFDVKDSHVFFGRSKLTDELIKRVEKQDRLIVVTGASGNGKSSLLRAGLLSQLQRGQKIKGSDQWYYFPPFTPGDLRLRSTPESFSPFLNQITEEKKQELEPFQKQRKVMIIDQFEECFTKIFDDSLREIFFVWIGKILDENPELIIILGMRSDFRAILQKSRLANRIVKPFVNVGYLSREELEAVIIGPANKVGLRIDGELKAKLLDDVEDFPESLPLLEFTLTELWNETQKPPHPNRLFLQDYERIGKIEGTLNKRANEAYDHLDNDREREIARRIFLELIQIGENRNTRRKIRLQNLINSRHPKIEELREVAEKLAKDHLISIDDEPKNPDNTIINLTHEALLYHWDKFKHWKDELEIPMLIERRIEYAADNWEKNGRKKQDFLSFGQVSDALEYQKKYGYLGFLDHSAEEFIDKSKKSLDTQFRIFLAVGLAILGGIGYLAMDALSQAWIAALHKEIATTNSKLTDDPIQGLVSAIEFTATTTKEKIANLLHSNDIATIQTDDIQPALQNAINNVQEYDRLNGHQRTIIDVDLSNDGRTIISADADGVLKVWDTKTGDLRPDWSKYLNFSARHIEPVVDVVLSHDRPGKWLLSASLDKTVKIWDTQSGRLLDTLKHNDSLTDVVISQDGKTIASASKDGTVKIWEWNGRKARLLYEKKQASNSIADIVMSDDGTTIASGAQDGTVNVWAVRSGKRLQPLSLNQSRVTSIAITPDGQKIIWGNENNQVIVWDTSQKEPRELGIHQGTVSEVKLSQDGKMIASAGNDAVIQLWDLKSEKLKYTLLGHQASLNKMLFSKDSKYLFSTGKDRTIRIWDTNSGHLLDILVGHTNAIEAINYDLASNTLVSAGGDRTVRLWYPDFQIPHYLQQNRASKIPVPSTVYAVATARHSSLVAVGGSDNHIWLWDHRSEKSIKLPKKHIGSIYTLAFSPDGKTLVSGGGSADEQITVWDVHKKRFKRILNQPIDTINAIAFHPKDNNLLASGGRDNKIWLWDLETGRSFELGKQYKDSIQTLAFNSDGTILASGDRKGVIRLWNVQSRSLIRTLKNNDDESITALAFYPSQKNLLVSVNSILVSANTNGRMLFWNTDTGDFQEITTTESSKPIGSIQTLTFSPNGQYLVSAGNDTKIRLWKRETNGSYRFERLIGEHEATVYSVAFTADGQTLISGGDDAKVNSWLVEKQKPELQPACARLQVHPAFNNEIVIIKAFKIKAFNEKFKIKEYCEHISKAKN